MTNKEAISYYENVKKRCLIRLKHCQAKPNRNLAEEAGIKRKMEAAVLSINSLEYMDRRENNWREELANAEWGD